jgi:hypothetical protein
MLHIALKRCSSFLNIIYDITFTLITKLWPSIKQVEQSAMNSHYSYLSGLAVYFGGDKKIMLKHSLNIGTP